MKHETRNPCIVPRATNLPSPLVAGVLGLIAFVAATAASPNRRLSLPVTYYKLPNGLRVVLSPEPGTPTAAVVVDYKMGFRLEPESRAGYAHILEHMMFMGSPNLGEMELIRLLQRNGGSLNASTTFDFTRYYSILPANKLETALWAEADRMRGLRVTPAGLSKQKSIIVNEIRSNVLSRPYGGFPWLIAPQYANAKWANSHNFYGEISDIEKASLDDIYQLFQQYYAPGNAVVAVVGDIDVPAVTAMIEKHFGAIPTRPVPMPLDLSEPRQTAEKRFTRRDPLIQRPALAISYHMPPRNTPEYFAMLLLDQIILQGSDSLLSEEVVRKRRLAGPLSGGINLLGNAFDYSGPMLWTASAIFDQAAAASEIIAAMDRIVGDLQSKLVSRSVLDRAIVKARNALYDVLSTETGVGRAGLLASFALFDDAPERVNGIEESLRKVTRRLLQKTAQEYLISSNRTVVLIEPASSPTAASGTSSERRTKQ